MIIKYRNRMYKVTKMCGGQVYLTYKFDRPDRSLDQRSKIVALIKKKATKRGFIPFYAGL